MSVESVEPSSEAFNTNSQYEDGDTQSIWNGRAVSLGNINNHNPSITLCGTYLDDVYKNPKPPSPFWGYFDSEAKKKNEFDIRVYQYHIRCNNEESKEHLEESFKKMSLGVLGIVIGVARISIDPIGGPLAIYYCAKEVWMGVEEFKKAIETSGNSLDEVRFVTWLDDHMRNTEELTKNSILDPWKPLDTPDYHYKGNPHYDKSLDSTFNPWTSA